MSRTHNERMTKLPLDVYRAENAWRKTAKARTGSEWRALIDAINGRRIRIQTACIVWWDWFAGKHVDQRCPDLDDLKDQWTNDLNAGRLKVRAALVAVGYPERIADIRTSPAVWGGLSIAEQARRA